MRPIEKQEESRRFEQLFAEMFDESDRGCILIGASVLDDVLCELLKKRLAKSDHVAKQAMEPLFSGMGPLSSFSARIKLAYCLGLIGKWEFEDLERIRKVRNKAAHEYTAKSFADNEIIQITQRLAGANHAVSAMKKLEGTEAEAGSPNQESAARSCNRELSKERLRFQLTVVYLAGRLDLQAFGVREVPSGAN
jgi:DNA-binding MltR family transcriptional regulator